MANACSCDHGTPARTSDTLVTLEIDGKPVTVPAGTSLMRAAAEAGISVPKLCATGKSTDGDEDRGQQG